jgi:hypothetical protein
MSQSRPARQSSTRRIVSPLTISGNTELLQIFDKLSERQQQQLLDYGRSLVSDSVDTTPANIKRGPGRPKTGRNPYETTKTVRNKTGKKYVYRVLVTPLANGKRKEKILGRVK